MPLFFALTVIALVLDQLSKVIVRHDIPLGGRVEFIPGLIHFSHVQNRGAAWGIFAGQKLPLIIFTAVIIVVMLTSAREVVRRGRLASAAFGLILGGAVGNLIDRITFGYVTDFLDTDTSVQFLRTFPVFNIADSALTIGVILMLLTMLFQRDPVPEADVVS
jgi:signal peptidase II